MIQQGNSASYWPCSGVCTPRAARFGPSDKAMSKQPCASLPSSISNKTHLGLEKVLQKLYLISATYKLWKQTLKIITTRNHQRYLDFLIPVSSHPLFSSLFSFSPQPCPAITRAIQWRQHPTMTTQPQQQLPQAPYPRLQPSQTACRCPR